jgi:uridylate kinase
MISWYGEVLMSEKQQHVVIKYGGSLLYKPDGDINIEQIRELSDLLKDLATQKRSVIIVVGGGRPARIAIHAAHELGASQTVCDYLGISASQQNAAILLAALHDYAYPLVPNSLKEALKIISLSPKFLIVMGGITPGQSTDAVAALLAEALQAVILIRATDVDGIYDRDPQKYSDAIKHSKLTYQQLIQLIQKQSQTAGDYPLFDMVAAQVIQRSQIPTRFIDGRTSSRIKQAVANKEIGTLISIKP